ncbi:N-6 DNA methylase, partial [bacterium]|nr:N-6 DNA methylase [bacterium]
MDLIGIENEAEFFPAGALSDALEDELRQITSQWSKGIAADNPSQRLTLCAESYLLSVRQIRNTPDRNRRQELRQKATHSLITALGYEYSQLSLQTALDGEPLVPLLARATNEEGRDVVWILEAPLEGPEDEASDPLGASFERDQFLEPDQEHAETDKAIEELLGDGIFDLRNGPRHVLVVGLSQIVLVDRHKWPARSVLRFDLQEIFSLKDTDTLALMACLISREARAPVQGVPIADRIEEDAQRNANAVTGSLKLTVRNAIEILGQEVLTLTGGKYPSGPRKGVWIEGPELSLECLRYMYRLLFLFYAEANPRLNILDLKDPIYASGYSIEALRELESVRLRTPVERNGTYLWESLQRTLNLLYDGNGTAMRLPAVKVSLLDPDSTPILNAVNLRNEAIQKVIKQLSLKQSRRGTARISYAKLGIGQLGAVYETLISFTGVVAKQDLIELRPQTGRGAATSDEDDQAGAGEDLDDADDQELDDVGEDEEDTVSRRDKVDLLAPSYFVPRSRAAEFKPEEIVFDGAQARVYEKGTFIYRLAGRDREKSASYYTPEPLARLLVKHALMERCRDMPADEILELKILEPAMGSAAFLVETTNQLADLYLERKQKETGVTIPQEDIVFEKQKVRAFISDRNCFGVDLNPVAVELGAISLWLNSLHDSEFSPWFGDQLHAGNSLIGARRASYASNLMKAAKKGDLWYNVKPTEIGWKGERPGDHIWQFLLPAKDMAKFDTDKSISEFAGDAQKKIKDWRKGGFFEKLQPHELKLLQKLSKITDQLFETVAADLAKSRLESNDAITLWPEKFMAGPKGQDFHDKERRNNKLVGADHASNTLPYKRLKTAMDAWCALWLWPLDKTDLLPSRLEFIHGMAMILEGGFKPDGSLAAPSIDEFADPDPGFMDVLEPNAPAKDLFKAAAKKQEVMFRETDVDSLVKEVEWLGVAVAVARDARFVHFDLIFADILKARGGFDIIVGNPPWSKLKWNEGDIIGDIDPGFVTRKLSATEGRKVRNVTLNGDKQKTAFLSAFASTKGNMSFTSSAVMNPYIGGGANNLYRCFIDLSFRHISSQGCAALIHQDGHLNDTRSGPFRRAWYGRVVKHFGFINEITAKNFAEIAPYTRFSLNIYRGEDEEISFLDFSNAFLSSQIEDSFRHDGTGVLPAIRDDLGKIDTRGHRDRIVHIDRDALSSIHVLIEDEAVPVEETRFLQPFSAKMLGVFRAMAVAPSLADAVESISRMASKGDGTQEVQIPGWEMDAIWDETAAQKELGVIRRETSFHDDPARIVLSGPMFFVGNPIYKTPNAVCRQKEDYEVVDLNTAADDYMPRTLYTPAVTASEYRRQLPRCSWDQAKRNVDFFRIGFRRRINLNSERSLIAALLPKSVAHINAVQSVNFYNTSDLLCASAFLISLPFDYLIKSSGKGDLYKSDFSKLPFVDPGSTAKHRSLRLACLTTHYADLWNSQAHKLTALPWHSNDPRLILGGPVEGPTTWDRTAALRNEFARRMALVEIDVLVAQSLGLSLVQLIDIYRIYFSVSQRKEKRTYFDRNGNIAYISAKGMESVGYLNKNGKTPSQKDWEEILKSNPATLTCQAVVDFMPGGSQTITRTFEGPFDTCDR